MASRFAVDENSTGIFIEDRESGKRMFCFGEERNIKKAAMLLNLCHHFFFKQDHNQPDPPKVIWTVEYVHEPETRIVFRGQNGCADEETVYWLCPDGSFDNVYAGPPLWDIDIPKETGEMLWLMFSPSGNEDFSLT